MDRAVLYQEAEKYFELRGSSVMKLTPEAGKEVCRIATTRGRLIERIEGGIWHNPGFEAKLDSIWDSKDWLREDPEQNNALAIQFIDEESSTHNVFIITG